MPFPLFFPLFSQKAFHEDVSSVMRRWLKDEELLPDHQKVTSRAQTHYIKVSLCGAKETKKRLT